jgi:tetratricopeptide (TPR) repeat protein
MNGDDRQAEEIRMLFQVGREFLERGQRDEALDAFSRMGEVARRLGIPLAEADALFYQARALESLRQEGRFGSEMIQKALDRYAASQKIYHDLGRSDEEAQALQFLADLLARAGQLDEALAQFQTVLAISRMLGSLDREARALTNIAGVHGARGEDAEAIANHQAALGIWRQLGRREEEARALIFLGNLHAKKDIDRALAHYGASLDISREAGYAIGEMEAHYAIARVHQNREEWREMIEAARAGAAIAQPGGYVAAEVTGLGMVALALENLGHLGEMAAPLTRAIELMKLVGHPRLQEYVAWLERVRGN